MGHDLRDDEIAIVISPVGYEVPSEWQGDINVGLVISPDNEIPEDIMTRVIGIATLMSAFLDVASDNPEIHDIVEEHRNYLMKLDEEEEKPVVSKDGNVYTLDIWTKTKGNA
tara:strand:+ start:393 stop:728 length:336 start_codon:yes stop_codon:yes gene_type:complete